ncbi:MAG: isoleucine--tRNA ligase [Elusimicrobia bacterium]|nr:isoleucine--tRNA ligase [Candidatus Obscuribacterium magneticum]
MDYSKTVNLLQTAFPMKADLPRREPEMLQRWEASRLYAAMQEKNKGKPIFLLHDGPPYANGLIHMGTALNKVLKDFVVKIKSLAGCQAPYKPGWDCHGLPIEHALFKELGLSKQDISRADFRVKATQYALGFVEKQKEDFRRLGVLGEWDNPYLTLTKEYEAGILEVFFELRQKGFITRSKKPGTWCAYDETALAEAEVEYMDKKSDSIFVRFPVKPESIPVKIAEDFGFSAIVTPAEAGVQSGVHVLAPGFRRGDDSQLFVLIWTTTPWTLPANMGLAFHPGEKYILLKRKDETYIIADNLRQAVREKLGAEFEVVKGVSALGVDFVGLVCTNPIHGRDSRVITADFVTMEDGTGIVHIAPGHGAEDFQAGQKWGLPVISPVDEKGRFEEGVGHPQLLGKHVLKDANKAVMEVLAENLLYHQSVTHSYPHCWRCKNPVIYRSTEQWFLRVDDNLRKALLREIDAVRWEPAYGIHRIKGMVEVRPDWCLSRQRYWGTPIAVFFCKNCRQPLLDPTLDKRIVELVRNEGGNVWYDRSVEELLGRAVIPAKAGIQNNVNDLDPDFRRDDSLDSGFRRNDDHKCAKCGSHDFVKEQDILDVWFDSGVSWHTVVEAIYDRKKVGELMYLEGSDQHRGWFQTSLIPAVALRNKAPYDTVLTHGFVVDGKGYKMSKSTGNVIPPQDVIKKFGADILRLWVAMSDYREDVRLSPDILEHLVDVYRKFRNVFRFLLQNTSDFARGRDPIPLEKLEEIDRWILVNFEGVKERVLKAYDAYAFHVVLSELNRFVAVTLSGFYLDAHKDTLYCEGPRSPLRRSAQTALNHLTRSLTVLLAPLLSFTSEEAYQELRKVSDPALPESVFLDSFASLLSVPYDAALDQKWGKILEIRGQVNDLLDQKRKEGVLRSSQEASVTVNGETLSSDQKDILSRVSNWPFLLQVADVLDDRHPGESRDPVCKPVVKNKADDLDSRLRGNDAIRIERTSHAKCERCWRYRPEVGKDKTHPTLCGRCVNVVSQMDIKRVAEF